MNYSKYIGCRVEFVLWKSKHTECRESGFLVRADGDGFLYKREEDGFMGYIDSSAHDFHAYMKPKDMNMAQLGKLAVSELAETDGHKLTRLVIQRGKIYACYVKRVENMECFEDRIEIDPDEEVEVTELFEEEE